MSQDLQGIKGRTLCCVRVEESHFASFLLITSVGRGRKGFVAVSLPYIYTRKGAVAYLNQLFVLTQLQRERERENNRV